MRQSIIYDVVKRSILLERSGKLIQVKRWGEQMNYCPDCGVLTDGTISEGSATWALCPYCMAIMIAEAKKEIEVDKRAYMRKKINK